MGLRSGNEPRRARAMLEQQPQTRGNLAHRRGVRCVGVLGLLTLALALLAAPGAAQAQVACPNPNPVVDENNCRGAGTSAWRVSDYSADLGGFTTRTSVDLGENVVLKIARNAPTFPATTANIGIYRMGYYGGLGGRLVHSANNVTINNDFTCQPMDPVTGKVDCGNWQPTYTVPGSALPASGVYLAKITASTGQQTHVVFTVRDDERQPESDLLYVLPMSSYQAYNLFGGKSLYFGILGDNTVSGTSRAVKVSFNRPLSRVGGEHDWFFGPDYNLLYWLEQQGYDISYSDDVQGHLDPAALRQHESVVISGHSEYWSSEFFNGIKAARDAGVNIASFSANTAYWKVRYEDNGQTLVCYKTIEGGGSSGSGAISANDWGPDGQLGTADDALGADGTAGTADDRPQNSTTTFRDNGAPPGDPGAPQGGRVGPDMPENQLFGVMYVGDNDARGFPVTVPPGNANDEFAADRVWRNTGISGNSTTQIGSMLVNWEWDAVPTQQQYLSRQPAGVKRLSATDVQTGIPDNSWLQDEGRLRNTTPPPGQPGTVNAVKYTASSGALVFASGTMQWSSGLSNQSDDRIQQATYNIFSDMGVQPDTPNGVTLDPGGSNRAPRATFTVSPNPTRTSQTVTFNASASTDQDGTITQYQWDLDGNGSFETSTGSNPVTTRSYSAESELDVRLRVTDNGGATDLAVRTLTIIDNQPPSAAFTAAPNPAVVGQSVTFNGSSSSDPDGSIARYRWDFDGNGSYETDAGSSATISRSFPTAGTVNVGLQVTDNGGKTATTTVPQTISRGGVSNYGDAVLDTPGLVSYWRMGEASGPALADSKGTNHATVFNDPIFGEPGGVPADPNTAVRFDGSNDYGRAELNLSGTNKLTVEFWLKWDAFANDDRLAMEFTSSYHDSDGGFLIDPNAFQNGGSFAVALGRNASRNSAYFARPSAGQWHHYAFVFDTSAPAAQQITPYVDGQAVNYTKLDSGTGAGNFANSTLYLMSRAGQALFGQGALDELAIYNRVLPADAIAEHFESYGTNRRPVAAFTATPNPVRPGNQVTFNGSTSSDPDGSIVKYEWDLDGNGSFETDTGSNPQTSRSYPAEGSVDVRLRVTDQLTGTDLETKTVSIVQNQSPTATFTANPNPAVLGQTTGFNASGSSDADGSIVKYEWDLDGNGSYETDTGTTPTASRQYTVLGTTDVLLRVTDDGGKTATSTLPVTVNSGGVSNYGDTVLDTPGLLSYWRMGETISPTFADSRGSSPATATNGVTFGVPGAVRDDPNAAARFDGVNDFASSSLNLSGTNKLTVEFWLRWNAFTGDDDLAMEFTPNFNDNPGGFLIDPNAPQNGGTFGVGIGNQATRNNVFFARPSAGSWHHYAFVFDTTAAAADQIIPYLDGRPVAFSKLDVATNSGNFANSQLYFMSRAGQALFGNGDLDEVAIYGRALDASTISEHFASYGTNRRPNARFTATPNPAQPGQQVTFNASSSTDPDGSIVKYEWDLDGNGSFETDTGATPQATRSYAAEANVDVRLRVFDNRNGTDTEVQTLSVGNNLPTASFTATPNPVVAGGTVAFNAAGSSDPDGSISKYEWDLDGNGTYETDTGTAATTSHSYPATGTVPVGLRVTDSGGATNTTSRSVQVVAAQQPPTASFTAAPNPVNVGQTVNFNGSASSDSDGPITRYEWDLDGDGTFETDTGTTPTAARAYAAPDSVTVRLRVTDQDGMTGTASEVVHVNGTPGVTYAERVLATGGLAHYWRMDDPAGSSLADSKGGRPATISGGPSLGAPSALDGASERSVSFDGVDDAASASLDLSTTSRLTVEFWLRWDGYANDEDLAMEFTPNFNDGPGGFLVDPNAPQDGGKFGIGIGSGLSRNNAYFTRPSAGTWHHYALVFDTTVAGLSQIVPYVDGQAVPYTKTATGTGAGPFANSQLYFMSRAGAALFGSGDLDELAIYRRALSAAEIAGHHAAGANAPPTSSFTAAPNPVAPGQTVTFNGGASSDPDGSISRYEWDLDGNGSYETDTGATATASRSYTSAGTVQVGLRVTDNRGDTATSTRAVSVQVAPTASFTATPSSVQVGQAVNFNASASSDPDGSIVKYEWDLDGNGSFETDTGATATASRTYTSAGTVQVGLRVTDNGGATATTTRQVTVSVNSPPTASFTATPGTIQPGQSVSFNATASSDSGGSITRYEWDLDGNGSFETNTGTNATTSRTYPTAGTIQVGLRVTDNDSATGQTTRTVIVNSPPAASFTVTPNPALTGQPVSFQGSGSSDSDGSIARYEWDLDGNGSYETDTGTTSTSSRAYSAVGTVTVGLRVTDNRGGTNTTTRVLTLQSGYAAAVLGTAGLRAYWRLGETSGTLAEDASPNNRDGTYQNGPTLGVAGLINGDPNRAVDFVRASSERVSVADNTLLDPTNVTLEAWLRVDSALTSSGTRTIISKTGLLGTDFAYSLEYERSGTTNRMAFSVSTGSTTEYTVPVTLAVGTRYHVAATYNGSVMRIYLNGAQIGSGLNKTGNIRNSGQVLRIGAFNSLDHWDGLIDEAAVYATGLPAATIQQHYNAGNL